MTKNRKRRARPPKEPEWYHKQAFERDGADWKSLWCPFCRKVTWRTKALAENEVIEMKASPTIRKPYLLDSYECPRKLGFHVGHNFVLGRPTLCVGEHR